MTGDRRLRFRGRVRLGVPPDPDRRRRELPPTASIEEHIDDFVGWQIAAGIPPEDANSRGAWVRQVHRETGVNFLTLPPGEKLAFIDECDRQLDELEAEELADADPDEPEH
jgi:hypothetical protein